MSCNIRIKCSSQSWQYMYLSRFMLVFFHKIGTHYDPSNNCILPIMPLSDIPAMYLVQLFLGIWDVLIPVSLLFHYLAAIWKNKSKIRTGRQRKIRQCKNNKSFYKAFYFLLETNVEDCFWYLIQCNNPEDSLILKSLIAS